MRGVANARYLSDLPGPEQGRRHLSMREALVRCHALDVPACDGLVVHGIHIATLRALETHGLLRIESDLRDKRNRRKPDLWRPTDRGVQIITADEPRLLASSSDALYVTDDKVRYGKGGKRQHQALSGEWVQVGSNGRQREVQVPEPEAVDTQTQQRLTDAAKARDLARSAGVADELIAERQLLEQSINQMRRLAQRCGVNIRDDLRVLERRFDAIDRKIRQQVTNRAAA